MSRIRKILKPISETAPGEEKMRLKGNTFRPSLAQFFFMLLGGITLMTGTVLLQYSEFPFLLEVGAYAGIVFISGLLGAVGSAFRHRDHATGQVKRDRRASAILEKLKKGEEVPPYSVYLRTFAVTNKLRIGYRENPLIAKVDRDEHRDLETLLSEAFETYEPMIALGLPGEHVGAGRILSEESTWKEEIELALVHASTIVMVPSHRAGTRWEVEWLGRNGWDKTLFLMPPRDKFTRADNTLAWEIAAQFLSPTSLRLPPYDARGMIFIVDRYGNPQAGCPLWGNLRPSELRRLIRSLRRHPGRHLLSVKAEPIRATGLQPAPGEDFDTALTGGIEAIRANPSNVIAESDRILANDPRDAKALMLRGLARHALGSYSLGLRDMQRAISLDSRFARFCDARTVEEAT
jgi:hypothetical protein